MSYASALKTVALPVEVPKTKNPDSSCTNYTNCEKVLYIWDHEFENDSDYDSPTKMNSNMQVGLMPIPSMRGIPLIPFAPEYHSSQKNQQTFNLEQKNNLFLFNRALDVEPMLHLLNREFLYMNLRDRNYNEIQVQLDIAIQNYESQVDVYKQNQVENFIQIQNQTNHYRFQFENQILVQNQVQHQFQAQNQAQNYVQNHVQVHNQLQIQLHREVEQQMIQQHMIEHENVQQKTVETGADFQKNEAFRRKIKSKSKRVLHAINPEYEIFEKITILDHPITLFEQFIGDNFSFDSRNNDIQTKILKTQNSHNDEMNGHEFNKSQFGKIGNGVKSMKRYSSKGMIDIYRLFGV